MEKHYLDLLSTQHGDKTVYEKMISGELTAYCAFVGKKFSESPASLMVVGRAMNGWETNFSTCSSLEDVCEQVVEQKYDFDDVINRCGFESAGRKRKYYYSTSKFWKLIKFVLEQYGESDIGNWYDDSKGWNQRIFWSNLYKVAPRSTGNPDWQLIKKIMAPSIEIFLEEIHKYSPKRILLVTDMNYLEPWKREPSFAKVLGLSKENAENYKYVVACGKYGESKIVVCKRPDVRGMSDDMISDMAVEIKTAFDN